MGYFSIVEEELRDRADDLGDQYGELVETVEQLASEFNLTQDEVRNILQGDYNDDNYDDSMDGDAASALASAGYGVDEDYGYAGDEY